MSTPVAMSNYKLTLSYDGQNYMGWQRHGDKPTIQYECEKAIDNLFGIQVAVRASGRTDRGAHANGQVITVELPEDAGGIELKTKLNQLLPADIRVLNSCTVASDFHARTSAIGKRYRYLIYDAPQLPEHYSGKVWHVRTPLDFPVMKQCCDVLLGQHDFASFATRTNFRQKNTTRTITLLAMKKEKQLITIDIAADSFLYKMVRNIVRALAKVGEGKSKKSDLKRILESRNRALAPGTAPATGLYLEKVYYSDDEQIEDAYLVRGGQ